MELSPLVATSNIFDKPEGSLKRNSVFTENLFDNLNMKKIKVERPLQTCAMGIFKQFIFFQNERK